MIGSKSFQILQTYVGYCYKINVSPYRIHGGILISSRSRLKNFLLRGTDSFCFLVQNLITITCIYLLFHATLGEKVVLSGLSCASVLFTACHVYLICIENTFLGVVNTYFKFNSWAGTIILIISYFTKFYAVVIIYLYLNLNTYELLKTHCGTQQLGLSGNGPTKFND